MEVNKLKKQYIISTAKEIVEYIDKKYCIEPDLYNIAEIINLNIGFLFDFNKIEQEVRNDINDFDEGID